MAAMRVNILPIRLNRTRKRAMQNQIEDRVNGISVREENVGGSDAGEWEVPQEGVL